MRSRIQTSGAAILFTGLLSFAAHAEERPAGTMMRMESSAVLPTGLGTAVDRDVERARAATERFKDIDRALAAGYEQSGGCMENPPHGGMGFHFIHPGLHDTTLDVERPEVLVYGQRPDGTFQLNGVEYIVPIDVWQRAEPPTIMGQNLKRAERLGIWYLHVWIWEPSPSGLFADWNPRVKC